MKTTFKNIAAGTFIALLLLVGNANATETKVSSLEATETALQIENWMVDEKIWNTNTIKTMNFAQATESSLELENWMTGDNMWDFNINIIEETDAKFELEDWMINDETWNTENIDIEPELKVEDWMINNNIWE